MEPPYHPFPGVTVIVLDKLLGDALRFERVVVVLLEKGAARVFENPRFDKNDSRNFSCGEFHSKTLPIQHSFHALHQFIEG